MPDKDLKSFKIGDNQRTGISNPVSSQANEKPHPESQSVGFARIEKILESETPESIEKKLNALIANLEIFQAEAKSNKDKLAGKKAIAAVERVADLLDYLFHTKAAIQPNYE